MDVLARLLLGASLPLGAAFGSFAGVCIERWPLGQSMRRPGSHCAACGVALRWYENLPLLSYPLLRGRCGHCGQPIAARLWWLEVLSALLFVALVQRLGPGFELVVWWPMSFVLLVVTFLDIDHFWVPDRLTYPAALLALGAAALPGRLGVGAALLGLVPAFLLAGIAWLFARLSQKDAVGLGDIKLLAVLGLCLGLAGALQVLLLASLQGTVAGSLILWGGGHRSRMLPAETAPAADADAVDAAEAAWEPPPGALPFGPFLSLAAWQTVLLPEWIEAGGTRVLGGLRFILGA